MPADPILSLGFAAVDWIEHYLVHGPGDVQGQPVTLDDEFAAFIIKAYRLRDDGERVVRRAFLSRSKGRSKSGLAAFIACFEALGPCRFDHFAEEGEASDWGYEYEPGEPVGRRLTYVEILNVATEEGQAGNTYDAIYYMLNAETASPELVEDYGVLDVGLTRINLPGNRGFIEPVTSADTSKDGGKSTFIVADETHLWVLARLKRLHQVMTRNLLKRKLASGWMLETSTMYAEGEGSVAEGTHLYAKQISDGKRRDKSLLFDHRQASDKWVLSNRGDRLKALREAYGPAAEWMNLDAIADSWDDPQATEGEFRRFWLNQPVPLVEPPPGPINTAKWELLTDGNKDHVPRMNVFSVEVDRDGVDGSIGVAGRRDDGLMYIEVGPRQPGTNWLVPTLVALNEMHGPIKVAVDGGGAAQFLIPFLEQAGLAVVTLTTANVAAACQGIVEAVEAGTLVHGPQPELDDAVAGAQKKPFRDGGFTFSRRLASVDVSPLLAVAFARWLGEIEPPPPEVWSIAEMVVQMRAEQGETSRDQPESQPNLGVIQRPDGSTFTPL